MPDPRSHHTGPLADMPRRCDTCKEDRPLGEYRRMPVSGWLGEVCDRCRLKTSAPTH